MTKFDDTAPWVVELLCLDFDLTQRQAAAIVGNLAYESGGFELLQELHPTVAGSRGGYGWAQWTGPRRRAYEAYCRRNNLNPAADEANYKFLFLELSGAEKRAIPALKEGDQSMYELVRRFERSFERAGVKRYRKREAWAHKALAAHKRGGYTMPAWTGRRRDTPHRTDKRALSWGAALLAMLVAAAATTNDWWTEIFSW